MCFRINILTKLISPDRVVTNPYYLTYLPEFSLAGFVEVPPNPEPWDKQQHYNHLSNIAHSACVDGTDTRVISVFYNDKILPTLHFDGDAYNWDQAQEIKRLNEYLPAVAFFKGNDDWSMAMRFLCFNDRDAMISEFGGEVGTLIDLLIGHN